MLAGISGPRKRKKRVRYGDADWDAENEPPANIIKTEKDSIVIKAEAELNNRNSLVLGKTPLGLSNAAEPSRDSSPSEASGPPIAESKVLHRSGWASQAQSVEVSAAATVPKQGAL